MSFPEPADTFSTSMLVKMNLKHAIAFSLSLFCYVFAIAMFFYFPGVEEWTQAALHPFAAFVAAPFAAPLATPLAALKPMAFGPHVWINMLMALLVFLPGVFGPLLFITRARRYANAKLILGSLAIAALFALAGMGDPLLYGRVALMALLTGHLLAFGLKAPESVPYNWMIYLAFALANFSFPDDAILAGANYLTAGYLLGVGVLLFIRTRKAPGKNRGYRVMVG